MKGHFVFNTRKQHQFQAVEIQVCCQTKTKWASERAASKDSDRSLCKLREDHFITSVVVCGSDLSVSLDRETGEIVCCETGFHHSPRMFLVELTPDEIPQVYAPMGSRVFTLNLIINDSVFVPLEMLTCHVVDRRRKVIELMWMDLEDHSLRFAVRLYLKSGATRIMRVNNMETHLLVTAQRYTDRPGFRRCLMLVAPDTTVLTAFAIDEGFQYEAFEEPPASDLNRMEESLCLANTTSAVASVIHGQAM